MNRLLCLLALLLGCHRCALAAESLPTSTELTGEDVSVLLGGQQPFRYLRGHVATEAERDAMQYQQLLLVTIAARQAADVPGCADEARKVWGEAAYVAVRLAGADYEAKNCRTTPAGPWKPCDWRVPEQGRHYAKAYSAAIGLRRCLTAPTAAAPCWAKLAMAPDIRGLLGLYGYNAMGEGWKCGAYTTLPDAEPLYDGTVADAGVLSTRVVVPPLDAEDRRLLHATHEAHQAVTRFYCDAGPPFVAGAVKAAHGAYERACDRFADVATRATCRHFRQVKAFDGFMDPNWSATDACTLRRMQDEFHRRWMAAQERTEPSPTSPYRNWIDARLDGDHGHWSAHMCANKKDTRKGCDTATSQSSGCFLVRPMCSANVSTCPVMSCQAWVGQWRAAHPEAGRVAERSM